MIESGLLLFFLIPGLLAYCALYGAFHSGRAIAPTPPTPSSIEAITLIVLCAAIVHVTTAGLLAMNDVACRHMSCTTLIPVAMVDPYQTAFDAINREKATAPVLGGLLGSALLQGVGAYALVRWIMRMLAHADRLPA